MKEKNIDLNYLKIAYYPYSDNFKFPGDRRRFCFFAKETELLFTKYKRNLNYDIVVFSPVSDLSDIKKLKSKGTKIILELVDAYFIETNLFEDVLRYMGKQFIHKNYLKMLFPRRYTSQLKKAFETVDAVICTTEDQKRRIQKYNKNVHIILDNMDDDVSIIKSSTYRKTDDLNILWEGLGSNLINFQEIASELNKVDNKINVNLHILTDLVSYKYFSKFYKLHSSDLISKYNLKVNTYLYQWNKTALATLASFCDLAIIPLIQNSNLFLGKSENKLILLWKLGLPVITSYSQVYSKTMKKAGIDMICTKREDWSKLILDFYKLDNKKRIQLSKQVREFTKKNYTKKLLIDKWNNVFLSIL